MRSASFVAQAGKVASIFQLPVRIPAYFGHPPVEHIGNASDVSVIDAPVSTGIFGILGIAQDAILSYTADSDRLTDRHVDRLILQCRIATRRRR